MRLNRETKKYFNCGENQTHDLDVYIYRGYYTEVRRYEFYLRVVKTIFYERAQRVSKILFSQREIVFEKRFHHVYYIVVNNLKPKSVILIFDQ